MISKVAFVQTYVLLSYSCKGRHIYDTKEFLYFCVQEAIGCDKKIGVCLRPRGRSENFINERFIIPNITVFSLFYYSQSNNIYNNYDCLVGLGVGMFDYLS